ncbi:dTDP-3-amino-3,6-dideoxy-alpha-D-glucopyranose N,N-dimethyltransferase [Rubripirellula tenax]|uniref:dTDP-3-amino-3,6-dideoxy-alpha-D-glucopyranose N,N-dimethyltransferase n=1 Tax=Rubripirellula tenax TaxID=2528015 RepID=A0A5C6FGI8_9BACT|nr:class I SAM-dependent methyltransferase [Rubripirellula tenax]TWU60558.1 dTDP-3-amino-3,6-dideoxy-alpha-D-glucopyranose N,N-dimethyltransferase [Rubripirellula tenax]
MADWYDHPQYFDMVFRDETDDEVVFFEEVFERFGEGEVKRLLEPGCGSGRLVVAMAAKGYDVTGLDLSQPMLSYLRGRMKRRKLTGTVVQGDMTDMSFPKAFDAAFCTFNTFRHLINEGAAEKHLRSVAANVRAGGLYILGFHLIPMDADPDCTERWKASSGGTKVSVTLRVIDFDRKRRQEMLRVSIKAVKRSGAVERIRSEFPLRLYTPTQAKRLLEKVADVWQIRGIYDFDYDLDSPRKIDNDLTDAVFVLGRKPS